MLIFWKNDQFSNRLSEFALNPPELIFLLSYSHKPIVFEYTRFLEIFFEKYLISGDFGEKSS